MLYTYGYYFGQIRVAPDDPERLYIMGVPILRSDDGGRTFTRLTEGLPEGASGKIGLAAYAEAVRYHTIGNVSRARKNWELAEKLQVNLFGTSPKFLGTCQKADLHPGKEHDLLPLRIGQVTRPFVLVIDGAQLV